MSDLLSNPKSKPYTQFIDYTSNLKCALVNQRMLVYILLFILTILSGLIVYLSTHQSAFILPYGFNKKVDLAVNRLTPAYMGALALSDAATYFNIDRNNVDEQHALFLSRTSPQAEKNIIATLKKRADYFHSNDVAEQFYPYERYVDASKYQVIIKGRLVRWLSGKRLLNRTIKIYLHYHNQQGYLTIDQWSYRHAK